MNNSLLTGRSIQQIVTRCESPSVSTDWRFDQVYHLFIPPTSHLCCSPQCVWGHFRSYLFKAGCLPPLRISKPVLIHFGIVVLLGHPYILKFGKACGFSGDKEEEFWGNSIFTIPSICAVQRHALSMTLPPWWFSHSVIAKLFSERGCELRFIGLFCQETNQFQ